MRATSRSTSWSARCVNAPDSWCRPRKNARGLKYLIWKVKERTYVGTQSVGGMVWESGGFFLSDLYAEPLLEFWGRELS